MERKFVNKMFKCIFKKWELNKLNSGSLKYIYYLILKYYNCVLDIFIFGKNILKEFYIEWDKFIFCFEME